MPKKISAVRPSRTTSRNRVVRFESLETRNLFAGDLCHLPNSSDDMDIYEPPRLLAISSVLNAEGLVESLRYPEAVPTFRSASPLATQSTSKASGFLWFGNSIDTYRFQVDSPTHFQGQIDGLTRDANLFLFDNDGNILQYSANLGANVDKVSIDLQPGTYYVSVVLWSVWGTRYSLDASMTSPKPSVPTTPTTPTNNTQPTRPVTAPGGTGTAPVSESPVSQPVQPLTEVAYVGTSRDYGFNAVGAPEAWNAGYSGKGVTVAVVDTGVDLDHPDLVQSLYVNPGEIAGNGRDDDGNGYVDDVRGYDFVDRDNVADDLNGHGTHVAGTIAAGRNSIGSTGVAPDAKIIPIRVLDRNGSGSDSMVATGIRYAAQLGADIINLSLGGSYSRTIESAIDFAQSLGSLIVIASGNESAATPSYPARFSATDNAVISVGAVNSSNARASFSNRVGTSGAVQVDAPGVSIYSTYLNGGYATLSGTSMATPHVAGLAALILSANPKLSAAELRSLITTSVTAAASGSDSLGLADARSAVAYAAAGLKTSPVSSSSTQNNRLTTRSNVVVRTYDSVEEVMLATPLDSPLNLTLRGSSFLRSETAALLIDPSAEQDWSNQVINTQVPWTSKLRIESMSVQQSRLIEKTETASHSLATDSLLSDRDGLELLLATELT
jgi:subtilisin family serine protease